MMNKPITKTLGQMSFFMGALTFMLAFFILSRTPADADMWWHLRAGQEMWDQKTILLTDHFSYTRLGSQWTNAFWLSDIVFYLLYHVSGYFGISLFVSLLGGATFFLIYRRLSGNAILNSAVITLAALTAAPIWSPRPQIFSFFMLAWLDQWLVDYQRNRNRPLWILVPFFAFWANVHGGWIWGFLLLLAHITGGFLNNLRGTPDRDNSKNTGRVARPKTGNLLFWAVLAALGISLNPNGILIWKLPFQTINVSMQIQEYLSPDFHRLDFHPFLWMLFLIIISARFASLRTDLISLLKVIGFAYLTFIAQRNIAPFAIITAPILADWGNMTLEASRGFYPFGNKPPASPPLSSGARAIINIILLTLLITLAVSRDYWLSTPALIYKGLPLNAVRWIKNNQPRPRLLNSYNWGGYLTWSLQEYPVFIDGRADLYGDEMIDEWREIVNGTTKGLTLLDKWHVNLILLEPGWPLLDKLSSSEWVLLYADEISVVYGR